MEAMRQSLRMLARDWRAGELRVLAADLVLMSDHPWQRAIGDAIASRGLQRASGVGFMSMVVGGEQSSLAGVKAVSDNYPLRGQLRIAPAPGAADAPAQHGPARGTVWLEERLATVLGKPVGSRIKVGRAELEVAAIL